MAHPIVFFVEGILGVGYHPIPTGLGHHPSSQPFQEYGGHPAHGWMSWGIVKLMLPFQASGDGVKRREAGQDPAGKDSSGPDVHPCGLKRSWHHTLQTWLGVNSSTSQGPPVSEELCGGLSFIAPFLKLRLSGWFLVCVKNTQTQKEIHYHNYSAPIQMAWLQVIYVSYIF